MYNRFLIRCITRYNGQWYCHLCESMLQSLENAERHSQGAHLDFNIETEFSNKCLELSKKICKNLTNHGIIIRAESKNYFCVICQCALPTLEHVNEHIKGRRHKKCVEANTVSKESTNNQRSLCYNTNIMQRDISMNVENLKQLINELQFRINIKSICENELKNLTNELKNLSFAANQIVVNNYMPYPQDVKIYKHFLMKCITRYNGQWYCYLCKSTLRSLTKAKRHSQEAHLDINSETEFLNKSLNLSNEICRNFVNHGIVMRTVEQNYLYTCVPCQCMLPSLEHSDEHIKGKQHQKYIENSIGLNDSSNGQPVSNIQTEFLNKSKSVKLSNEICMKLTNHGIIMRDVEQDYFCLFCECALPSLEHSDEHIKGKQHQRCIENSSGLKDSTNDQPISNIQTEFLNKSESVKLSNEICMKLTDHGIIMRDVEQDYFCLSCECALSSLEYINEHIREKQHQKCIEKSIGLKDSTNIQSKFLNKSGFVKLSNKKIMKLIHHRIIIRDYDYFCTFCQFSISVLRNIDEHIIGKRHQKRIQINTVSKDSANNQHNLNYNNLLTTDGLEFEKKVNQYLTECNDIVIKSLPQRMQKLLKNVDETVAKLLKQSNDVLNDIKSIQLENALKHTLKNYRFPVEICIFGSRFTGLAFASSDVDIYLNFGDECTEDALIKSKCKEIQSYLSSDCENWKIRSISEKSIIPIIRAKHILTGLKCDISFKNGLSMENSRLIKSFIIAYPPCRKLILFLKKWLSSGNLNGPNRIKSYALSWMVIFYLQVKYKIPSIAALIKNHNQSKIISGWETGVGDTIHIDIPELSMHQLLLGFFEYYKSFDYAHCVICPLLGIACDKESFTETSLTNVSVLPNSMTQLQEGKPKHFRVDSPMCVQDPFDLAHNLTKTVRALILECFKQYCNESASILCDITIF